MSGDYLTGARLADERRTRRLGIEYVVAMQNGARFWTGGFEEPLSLLMMIRKDECIDGTWQNPTEGSHDPDNRHPWKLTWLNPMLVSSITDLRGDGA